jgi:predicted CoA-binding protein
MTGIITLFLEMKPTKEILAKVLLCQLSYIIKQFKKVLDTSVYNLLKDLPNRVELLESYFEQNNLPEVLTKHISRMTFKKILTLDDIHPLLKLIWENRNVLRLMKAGTMENTTEATKRMAFHLCKMVRIHEDINFVAKKVKLHRTDASS